MLSAFIEVSPAERHLMWENAVRGAAGGDVSLFVDKPPVENPAEESSAPVRLAR